MEIKDIDNVQKSLKVEIDEMGRNVNRDELAKERFFPILKQEFDLIFLRPSIDMGLLFNKGWVERRWNFEWFSK